MQVSKSSEIRFGPLHERERAGIFSLLHYSWLHPFLSRALQRRKEEVRQRKKKILPIAKSRRHLTDTDIGDVPQSFTSLDAFSSFSRRAIKTNPYKEVVKSDQKIRKKELDAPPPGARTLTITLFKMIRKELIISGVLKAVSEMSALLLPLLLFHFLAALSGVTHFTLSLSSQQQAYGLVLLILVISSVGAYGSKRASEILRYSGTRIQQALSISIYKKLFHLAPHSRAMFSNGRIFTLLTNDVRRVGLFLDYVHVAWLGTIQIVLTSILLISMLGIGAITGLIVLMISIPLQYLIVRSLARRRTRALTATDARIRFVDQLLSGIRVVAFNDWGEAFYTHASTLRKYELSIQRELHILTALLITLMNATPLLATIVAFATTMFFSTDSSAEGVFLSASTAFASLAMFGQLRSVMGTFPPFLAKTIDARISLRRIAELLRADELQQQRMLPSTSNTFVELKSLWATWGTPRIESTTPSTISTTLPLHVLKPMCALRDISLLIPSNSITVIIGPVGSGKSSLLQAIMGQMSLVSGSVSCVSSCFAYAAQLPWIRRGTLRDNIVFGAPFDLSCYRSVIMGTQLRTELRSLPLGDLTEIGGTPSLLSGGQCQRVAVARALYAAEMGISPFLILDDPLSSLDAKVAKALWDTIFTRDRPNYHVTRLIVTHAQHLINELSCDWIIQMEDGRIKWQGSPASWTPPIDEVSAVASKISKSSTKSPFAVSSTITIHPHHAICSDNEQIQPSQPLEEDQESIIFAEELTELEALGEGPRKSHRIEMMMGSGSAEGDIPLSLHSAFWRRFSRSLLIFTIITLVASHWTRIMMERALAAPIRENFYHLYWILAGSFSFTTLLYAMAIAIGSWRAARSMYRDAFAAVVTSPLSFFNQGPIGAILSRLTRDTEVVDYDILDAFRDTLGKSMLVASILLLVVVTMPVALAIILPILLFISNSVIIRHYHAPMLDLEFLIARSRATFLQQTGDTLSGISVIRAFTGTDLDTSTEKIDLNISNNTGKRRSGIQNKTEKILLEQSAIGAALRENARLLDRSAGPTLLLASLQGWASLRFELVAASCVALTALFCVWADVEIIVAGLVIHQLLGLSRSLYTTIVSFIDLELALCSFRRLMDLERQSTPKFLSPVSFVSSNSSLPLKLAPQSQPSSATLEELPEWPTEGAITLRNVSVKYAPNTRSVLSNISLEIVPGERLAIIGRTGSGKSTLVQALFGLVPLSEGIITIDDVDISLLPPTILRQRLAIIPQEPVIFNGISLRFNLDPLGRFSDAEIWEALEEACIATHLRHALGKETQTTMTSTSSTSPALIAPASEILDQIIHDHSAIMSQGQAQQLCLARALLKRSRVLVLDEATSMVDTALDTHIQQSIRRVSSYTAESGKGTTVITIAHRLLSILDYDRIVILQDGCIAEMGTPQALIADPSSLFTHLVKELGPAAHEHIRAALAQLAQSQ